MCEILTFEYNNKARQTWFPERSIENKLEHPLRCPTLERLLLQAASHARFGHASSPSSVPVDERGDTRLVTKAP